MLLHYCRKAVKRTKHNKLYLRMIINLISSPRNISTALMYSFAQRNDTKVMDEPLYGYYLKKTGIDHPGGAETIASMSSNPSEIINQISNLADEHHLVFVKNMAHHHTGFDWKYLNDHHCVFLIRDPKQLIASFAQVIEHPTIDDIGLKHEFELFEYCQENSKHSPIIIDSNDLLIDPKAYLTQLCEQLKIPFTSKMLSWKKGPIPEDGVWAPYWYKNVHETTGFSKQKTSSRPLELKYKGLYKEASKYFQKLSAYKSINI